MTLAQLIIELERIDNRAKPVLLDFGEVPGSFACWRGDDAKPALGHGPRGDFRMTVGELAQGARMALATSFKGHDRRDYTMREDAPVHVANWSDARGKILTGIDRAWKNWVRLQTMDLPLAE